MNASLTGLMFCSHLSSFTCCSVNEGKSPPIPYVYVNSSGSVKNYRPMQVVLACSLEMYAFPFDKQNCSLTFRSWLHSGVCPACNAVVETFVLTQHISTLHQRWNLLSFTLNKDQQAHFSDTLFVFEFCA